MQAHPAYARPATRATTPAGAAAPVSVGGALRAVEAFLMRGGQRTARRNAWSAVLEDRRRAEDRRAAQHVLETLGDAPAPAWRLPRP
ncbi:hypothetical protein [Streptomyces sp. ICBB 8177]|uniref:SCO2195 family GlnR-regulated protein n=1 Tax=Streptomyces sp. ICBB 8177 TaxID=563922 RepID=UPI000D6845A0|nr:hypothetical protein [Streptomyces sp. ICBB 8177]PWI43324.1 hypothetical protein CK485_14305 [Streptomyces sp. ICBB 8177]